MSSLCYWIAQEHCIKACFMDYAIKTVSAPDAKPGQRDDIIAKSLEETMVYQYRPLGNNVYQVIAANYQTIESVYNQLPVQTGVQLVPYGLAVLSLLHDKGVDLSQMTVFIDHQPEQVWVSIFDSGLFNAPRSIKGLSIEQIKLEVDRTIKHYVQQRGIEAEESTIRIMTNLEIGCAHPAIEGLKRGRFDINFDLPTRVIANKRRKFWIKQGMMASFIALIVCLSIVMLVAVFNQHTQLSQQITIAEDDLNLKQKELNTISQSKMYSLIKTMYQPDFRSIYSQVKKDKPLGSLLTHLIIEENVSKDWDVKATYSISDTEIHKTSALVFKKDMSKDLIFKADENSQYIEMSFQILRHQGG